MQTDVFDYMAFFGFIISMGLLILTIFEYRMKSEQHKPILKLSWFNLPPKDPQERNESSICIENIGTKEAHVLDVRIEFSYVDEPIIIPLGQKRIVDPGLTSCFSFDFVKYPVGKHEILGTVVTKHRKRPYSIACEIVSE